MKIIDGMAKVEVGIASPESTEEVRSRVEIIFTSKDIDNSGLYLRIVYESGYTYYLGQGGLVSVVTAYKRKLDRLKECIGADRKELLDLVKEASLQHGLPLYLCEAVDTKALPSKGYVLHDFAVTPEERQVLFNEGVHPTALLQTALDGSLDKSYEKAEKYTEKLSLKKYPR